MSSEGGGILGGLILIAIAAPVIIAAVQALLIGGAIVGATALAVSGAKKLNDSLRKTHTDKIQKQIQTQHTTAGHVIGTLGPKLADTVKAQREAMLEMYKKHSNEINTLADKVQKDKEAFLQEAESCSYLLDKDVKQIHDNGIRLRTRTMNVLAGKTGELSDEMNKAQIKLKSDIIHALGDRSTAFDRTIGSLKTLALGNDPKAVKFADDTFAEAKALFDSLSTDPDANKYVGDMIKNLNELAADYNNLKIHGMTQAMITTAVSFAQKTMETIADLDVALHTDQLRRERLNLATAELEALVQNCRTISLEQGERLPHDANYWADGMLGQQLKKAEKLLCEAKSAKGLKASDLENLLRNVDSCRCLVDGISLKARKAYINCYQRLDLMRKSIEAMRQAGWTNTQFGFEGVAEGDYRRAVVARFTNPSGAVADVVISPKYNTITNEYEADIKVERADRGVINEQLREEQLNQLNDILASNGVRGLEMKCNKSTAGMNAPLNRSRIKKPSHN